ncbi:MAG: ATP-grasp domain-containing protein [Planctomycetes bacterium]|nr:ATP-grasp domain-containing protein [Planctomycetota bacterium]
MERIRHYRNQLESVIAGKPWIVAAGVLVNATQKAEMLLELGADRVFAIGTSRGTGRVVEDPRITPVQLEVRGTTLMGGLRASEAALDALPQDVVAALDAFDPGYEALVVRDLYSECRPVGGRRTFGARPMEWIALEDKTCIDAFWDAASVRRAPSRVAQVDLDALRRAHQEFDAGHGSVWVADNKDGWHGAAQGVRVVRSESDAQVALEYLQGIANEVRVMPFLEGIPCSIHGFVHAEDIAVFRPCEMLVFGTGSTAFAYAGAATYWEPSPEDCQAMRNVARDVGRHLQGTLDYRGAYCVDGILTADGFLPTELNPRFGAAVGNLAKGVPGLPLYLLHLAMVEGLDLDYRLHELEDLVVTSSRANPSGRSARAIPAPHDPRSAGLVIDDDEIRFAREGESAQLSVELGPSTIGSYLVLEANAAELPYGPPLAPMLCRAFAFLDEQWELGIGQLEAARSVR